MKLEDIGFYTLTNERARNSSMSSPLHRCELILTNRCNFNCPYCRGLAGSDLPFKEARRILDWWISEELQNVRFSGGEPTLYPHLHNLVQIASHGDVKRIAISTNGSSSYDEYRKLIDAGVNDFSISLDACCASTADIMSGKQGMWNKIISNIEALSAISYVTVGIVLTEANQKEAGEIINFVHNLGVADIRVIPAAQYMKSLNLSISDAILNRHPILKYRIKNTAPVRGLSLLDSRKCKLVLDDMAVWDSKHYPCIIYLREGGKPIGYLNDRTRQERYNWYIVHDSYENDICRNNCLDVCVAFNNITAIKGDDYEI